MTLPAILFGILISTLYGAAFHLWRGGSLGRLILYLILAWAGFWTGQVVGNYFGWTIGAIGPIYLGSATIFSIIFLSLGYWLSLVQVQRK